jgi:hypothetical protein
MNAGTGTVRGPTQSLGRAAVAIRDLHPGSFAFVMATGIISTGTFQRGEPAPGPPAASATTTTSAP